MGIVGRALAQTGTPTPEPGVGPAELPDLFPVLVRAAWFCAGFLVVALVGIYVVVPAITRFVRRRNPNNPTLHEAIARYLEVFALIVGLYVGAGVAGYGRFVGNSAIVIAAATLALGVAGQEVIGSLVSGLALVFDTEFNVGDYIEWEGGAGTVESITLRVTRVRTPDDELVTVPNTILTAGAITRPFGRDRFRVVDRVGVDDEDDVDDALAHLEAAAREIDEVRDDPPPAAYVEELGDDEVVLRVHYWIGGPRQGDVLRTRSAYARAVTERLGGAGITVNPAPERELRGRIEVDEGS